MNIFIALVTLFLLASVWLFYILIIKPKQDEKKEKINNRYADAVFIANTKMSTGYGDKFGNEFYTEEIKHE